MTVVPIPGRQPALLSLEMRPPLILCLALTTFCHFSRQLIPNYANLESYAGQILTYVANGAAA
jgi:hypothetical protein